MRYARLLLWLILGFIAWAFSLIAAICEALADDCDALMCWLEHRQ